MLMKKTVKYLIIFLSGIQVVLGFLWIVSNWNRVPDFLFTEELLEISATGLWDEYTGIAYPIIIRGSIWMEKCTRVPFFFWIYTVHLPVAFLSGSYFLSCIFHQKMWKTENVAGSLFLMTVPMSAQIHLCVLPYSLSLSLFLCFAGLTVRIIEDSGGDREKRIFYNRIGMLVLIGAGLVLLLPETFFMLLLTGITVAFILGIRRKKMKTVVILAALTVSLGVGAVVNRTVQQPGSRGKIQKSVSSMAVNRFVWPYFDENYYFWPAEIKEVMSVPEAKHISGHPERVKDTFGPMVEGVYGRKKAAALYRTMASASLKVRTREIVYRIAEDFVSYLCPQVSYNLQLKGVGAGVNAYNYNRMRENAPVLTKYYVNYSLNSFFAEAILCILYACFCGKKPSRKKMKLSTGVLLTVPAVWQVLYYTFTESGMADYKNVWYVTVFYGIWILYGLHGIDAVRKGEQDGQDCSADSLLQ